MFVNENSLKSRRFLLESANETKMTCKLFYCFSSKGTQHSSSFFQGKDHSNFDKLHGLLNKLVNLLSHLKW